MTGEAAVATPVDPAAEPPRCDILVQLAGCRTADEIREGTRRVVDGLRGLGDDLTIGIACGSDCGALSVDAGGAAIVPVDAAPPERFPIVGAVPTDAYRALFDAGRRSGAMAMALIGTEVDQLTPGVARALLQPIIADDFDVVVPVYDRQVYDGLLNAAIVYPLTRALYGRRIPGQLGVDFGFSARVAERLSLGGQNPRLRRPVWILPQAIADDMRICQAVLGVRLPAPPDSIDLATVFAQVLGSLFVDMEQRAPFWQRVQRSQAVPTFGTAAPGRAPAEPVDVRPMIESFVNAFRNLQRVWTILLPPATLVALKRLTLVEPERFRLPDDLWARIVYDFALGHRLRVINRDHLLGALVPLYLAWVASYALEVQGATPAAADVRIERLCAAFEAEKPYLVRRWRWPDRFNP